MKEKMLLQLHEQYAINNNANLGSVVSLLVSTTVILGTYGGAFLTLIGNNDDFCGLTINMCTFTWITIFTLFIFAIMFHICLYQGMHQRYEQFITYKIRKEYNIHNISIFPSYYTPYGKGWIRMIPGLFGEFVKILLILTLLISILSFISICHSCCCIKVRLIVSIILIIVFYINDFVLFRYKYNAKCNNENHCFLKFLYKINILFQKFFNL